jgi:hypothetical protein
MSYRHCFSSLFIRRIYGVKAKKEGLKLNGTHQILVYVDDVSMLVGSIY